MPDSISVFVLQTSCVGTQGLQASEKKDMRYVRCVTSAVSVLYNPVI